MIGGERPIFAREVLAIDSDDRFKVFLDGLTPAQRQSWIVDFIRKSRRSGSNNAAYLQRLIRERNALVRSYRQSSTWREFFNVFQPFARGNEEAHRMINIARAEGVTPVERMRELMVDTESDTDEEEKKTPTKRRPARKRGRSPGARRRARRSARARKRAREILADDSPASEDFGEAWKDLDIPMGNLSVINQRRRSAWYPLFHQTPMTPFASGEIDLEPSADPRQLEPWARDAVDGIAPTILTFAERGMREFRLLFNLNCIITLRDASGGIIERNPSGWITADTGFWDFDREWEGGSGNDGLVQKVVAKVWDRLLDYALEYGASLEMLRYSGVLVDISYRGGCDQSLRKGVYSKVAGLTSFSPYSKNNECSLRCLFAFFQSPSIKPLLGSDWAKHFRTIKKMARRVAETTDRALEQVWGQPLTPQDLAPMCNNQGVNLRISRLMEGDILETIFVFGVENHLGEVHLLWEQVPGQVGVGHYKLLTVELESCELCGSGKIPHRVHRCVVTCDSCGIEYRVTNVQHMCLEKVKDLESKRRESAAADELAMVDRLHDRRSRLNMEQVGRRAIVQKLMGEVDLIMSGECDNEEQWHSFTTFMASGQSVAVLGDAGTGKSFGVGDFFLNQLHEGLIQPEQLAFVGNEAVGVQTYMHIKDEYPSTFVGTMHSFMGCTPMHKPLQRLEQILSSPGNKKTLERLQNIRYLVVEEIGCCCADLFEQLGGFIQRAQGKYVPFGETVVILTGDFNQRPPVTGEQIFESRSFLSLNIHTIKLMEQKRLRLDPCPMPSDDDNRRVLLRGILEVARGVAQWTTIAALNNLLHRPQDVENFLSTERTTILTGTNQSVYELGVVQLNRFYPPETQFRIYAWDTETESRADTVAEKHTVKFDHPLLIAVGARCMYTTNRYKGAVNGDMCWIDSVHVNGGTLESIVTRHMRTGDLITIKPLRNGRYRQYFIRLAYAMTTPKAQGKTLDRVLVWEHTSQQNSVGYTLVNLSRVQNVDNLCFRKALELQHIVTSPLAAFYMSLAGEGLSPSAVRSKMSEAGMGGVTRSSKGGDGYIPRISVRSKSVTPPIGANTSSLTVWTRDMPIAPAHALRVFDNKIFFDFETAPVGGVETVYSAYATYWREGNQMAGRFEYGVSEEVGLQPDCIARFVGWLHDTIILPTMSGWRRSSSPLEFKIPVTFLIAYNGSGFDFGFIMRELIHRTQGSDLRFQPEAINGSRIMSASLVAHHADRTAVLLKMWDPYLMCGMSLSKAYKSFVGDTVSGRQLEKAVFPHLYLKKVGAEAAFAVDGATEIPIDDFPHSMRQQVRRRVSEGSLDLGVDAADTVMFDLRKEHTSYLRLDVELLESLYEALSVIISDWVGGQSLLPERFTTLASFSWYSMICMIDADCIESVTEERITTKLFALNIRLTNLVREGLYGGRCLPRAIRFVGRKLAYLRANKDNLPPDTYSKLTDCLYYLDINGMYHNIMQNRKFPYGPHMELTLAIEADAFLQAFMLDGQTNPELFPMFMMRCDLLPNPHDKESAIPSRGLNGRLLWDNNPIIQGVYTSIHLQLALQRGYILSNPTWALVWGAPRSDRSDKVWRGPRKALFREAMEKCRKQRELGGARKTFGKGTANRGYGSTCKKDRFTKEYIWSDRADHYGDLDGAVDLFRDRDSKCTYFSSFQRNGDERMFVAQFKKLITGENEVGARIPWIGAFCLAYSHVQLDNCIQRALGPGRQGSDFTCQVLNGDTDSIIIHYKYVTKNSMDLHLTKLGHWSDDLDKKYPPQTEVKFDEGGHPSNFCKVVHMVAPAKKMYAMEVLTPDNRLLTIQPKSKGLPKGSQLVLTTGAELEAAKLACNFSTKLASDEDPLVRKAEREKLETQLLGEDPKFDQGLNINHFIESVENPEQKGIVGNFQTWKSYGLNVPTFHLQQGTEFFSKNNVITRRHVSSISFTKYISTHTPPHPPLPNE